MSDQSGSPPFQALFEAALGDYEKQTGISLANHPLAEQLQKCQSVDSITALLQEQTRAFSEFRGNDKIIKSLKIVVSALSKVSATAALGQAIGMSFPPADALHTGLAILLTAFKGVSDDLDVLVDLLESMEHFLKRLDIYTKVPPTPAMTEIVTKIMVELLSTLALVTKHIKQGKPKKFVKKLFGENDVEAVLQRLDRLTQDEARTTVAEALGVVHGLVKNMRVVIDDGKTSTDSVRDALEILQKMAREMNEAKRDKLQQDVRSWLSPPDPWKNYNLARESRHTETTTWFVGGSTLSEWKSAGPSSLLWVHGKPGAGKSVLCSTIIEDIDSMTKFGLASLAFFYFDFREDEKRDLRGLLSSVLVQLCHQSDSYCHILSSFYSEHKNGSQDPSDAALKQCLKNILDVSGQAPVYLIVDGLDECSNTSALPSPREKVLTLLTDLIDSQVSNLRICVTSRPEFDIKVALEPLAFHSVSLHDESGQRKDIDNYIRSVVNADTKMRRWRAADRELVIDALINKSDGMFRWVYCQIVYLRGSLPGRIRRALDELPETLDETYERSLRNIDKTNWEFAHRLLQCVAVAFRPLKVVELAEILSFDFKTGPIPKFHEDLRLEDPVDAVLSTTSSLLAIVDVGDFPVIQFSHFSVKEYLTSARLAETNDIISRRYHISMTPAHTLAAQACLGILLHLDKNVIIRGSLEEYPLAEYAAEHWVEHARFDGVSGNVEDAMKHMFDARKSHLSVWLWIHGPRLCSWPGMQTRQEERPVQPTGTPLHYAALCGLYTIVKFLIIQHSLDVRSRRFDDGSAPLHLASRQGHDDVACLLLEHNADTTALNNDGSTPLHLALDNKHKKVAHLLLEHGTDSTAQDNFGWTPLHLVSQWGDEEVARSLLERGADTTAQTNIGSTPLHLASEDGHEEVARLLLEHGADSTAQDKVGSTPLQLASQWGREEVTRLLLEHGAKSTTKDTGGWTPLHHASQWGREEIAHILLENRADITAPSNEGLTPLHVALLWEQEQVARTLLELGADTTAKTNDGWTPLHTASQRGYEEVVRSLLEQGTDTTALTNEGSTPLHLASEDGHEKVAQLLLDHGADSTARDKAGWTPLHLVSRLGDGNFALSLLEHGADKTAQTNDGWTPLHLVSRLGHGEVARLLLEHGADTAAQTKDGWTPLHLASEWGNEEVIRSLLKHDADTTAQDKDGSTPLHFASEYGYEDVVCLLLEHGADSTAQDKNGWSPLHFASGDGHQNVARSLIDHGADTTAQTDDGWTPLHVASHQGNTEVVHLLLEHGADTTAQDKDRWTSLHLVSRWGLEEIAVLLLKHGADTTAQTVNGSTPLHLASKEGHQKVARSLIDHGAGTTAQTKDGWTPLHLVSRWGHEEVARSLLEHGADTAAQTGNGSTPLHLASKDGRQKVVRLLLKHGVEPTAQDKDGWTPLHLALQWRHGEVARLLLEHGADSTAQDKDGWTPLHLVSHLGHVEVARLLLEHGAESTAQDKDGWTPLHLASQLGHEEVVCVLLGHGADAMAESKYGSTPFSLALQGGHIEVARLLLNTVEPARVLGRDANSDATA